MGRRTKLQIAEDQRAIAEAELATMRARQELDSIGFLEANPRLVPQDEYPQFDLYDFSTGRIRRPWTRVEDRQDGRYFPLYETEEDLSESRANARNLHTFASTALGAMESLANYTLGEGFEFEAVARDGIEPEEIPNGLLDEFQNAVDDFLSYNGFTESDQRLDRELHDESRIDGEVLIHLRPEEGTAFADLRSIDELARPRAPRELEDWMLAAGMWSGDFMPSWSFGVFTRADRPSQPLYYHLVRDSGGSDWDVVPARDMVHIKRNTSRNAKRGISDYYPIIDDVRNEATLKTNTALGGAAQAAMAFIVENAPGATRSGAEKVRRDNASTDYTTTTSRGEIRTWVEQFKPGTVKSLPHGKKYLAGPMGQSHAPTFIQIVQMIARSIGVRWNMPEYLISGDASNANYSSTLVASNPFVLARKTDQQAYKGAFCELAIKAVRMSYDSGRFARFGLAWRDILRLVKIKCEAPDIESTDEAAMTARNQTLHQNGVLSRRTWAAHAQLDYEEEQGNIAREPAPASNLAGVAAVGAAMESVRSTSEARDILRQLEMF